MRKLILALVVVVMCVGVAGCGSKINHSITSPNAYRGETGRTFNAPYDKVWKATVDTIGQSFFVLGNIEKDSGIMSLSFSSNTPEKYLDCGTVTDFGKLNGEEYSFTFKGTDTPVSRWITGDSNIAMQCIRNVSINCKSNILVQKISEKSTYVKINTNHVFLVKNACEVPYSSGLFVYVYHIENMSNEMSFTGDEEGTFDGQNSLVCRSKKTLEKIILDQIEKTLMQ